MNLKPRPVKAEILSRKELLIALYNQQHDQMIRNRVDRRVAERMLVANLGPQDEATNVLTNSKKLAKVREMTLEVIMDEILQLETEEQDAQAVVSPDSTAKITE